MRKKIHKMLLFYIILFINICIFQDSFSLSEEVNGLEYKSQKITLILFYMSTCGHCKKFTPVLSKFVENTGISFISFSIDGNKLPGLSNSFNPTSEEISVFFPNQVPSVPAVFIADSEYRKIYPVLKGSASYSQLEKRVSYIIERIKYGK